MLTCYLGVGSNLGDRLKNIKLSIQKIDTLKETKVIKVSRIIETKPLGGPRHQPKFLNACLRIQTSLSPKILLKKLKIIENEIGRRKTVRFGPRIIDLDILLYGDKSVRTKLLRIPHPRLFERSFVVEPLTEVL
ncbi:MAG: 2-amino-4-hydroxy-6-hydroxymethyldihydropteridine diphosphokinase [Candidatus Omnitrophica bacterium]|nr:2-amino-4-hydroxy-6-hydroxymethyldihydropteridine diphosphokinase [Candidatus Omnitrophota bacterium]